MKHMVTGMLLALLLVLAACGGAQQPAQAPAATEAPAAQEETNTEADTSTDTKSDTEAAPTGDEADSNKPVAMTTSDDDCANPDILCVGLVTDVGEVDDKSFNQAAWEGVRQVEDEYGAFINYVETTDANDYGDNIALFVEKQYDVIVTVGFALGEATINAATENPAIHFIGVDQIQVEAFPNVAGLTFNEDKAGFLAGALAAQLSQSGTIAAVLGTDLVPPVVAFKEGYEAGAKYINPNIQVISTYHPGGIDVAFTDPEWGATTARQAIDQGTDVVFAAGGKTGNGALIETASTAGLYCIGVDSDQWETAPEAHACLISSATKQITPGVVALVGAHVDGTFPSGNYVGSVGLAPFHDFEGDVAEEIVTKLDEIEAGLKDGTIETGYTPGG